MDHVEPKSPSPGRVKAECGEAGWFFDVNGRRLGPFSLRDMDLPDFDARLSAELRVEPKEIVAAKLAEYERPIGLRELAEILSTTVKRDDPAKLITFLGMLLAQTEEDQCNIALRAR